MKTSGIILELKAQEIDDDDPKNGSNSSEDEGIVYSRRESNESCVSDISKTSETSSISNRDELDVETITDSFKNNFKIEEDKKSEDGTEKQSEKLAKELKIADEEALTGRLPMRNSSGHSARNNALPYANQNQFEDQRSVNLYSGGSIQEAPLPLINDAFLTPETDMPVLHGQEISEFFNNLQWDETNTFERVEINSDTSFDTNFSVSHRSPHYSSQNSPISDQGYASTNILSPQSYTSCDTDASPLVGSPIGSAFAPGTSQSSDNLPRTLPDSSEDETKSTEALNEIRNMIDSQLKDIKQNEWISACSKDDEELFSTLREVFSEKTRLTDRKLVRIYATIAQIMKRKLDLKRFFIEEKDLLFDCKQKDNPNQPLLLRYVIETMRNQGVSPEIHGFRL